MLISIRRAKAGADRQTETATQIGALRTLIAGEPIEENQSDIVRLRQENAHLVQRLTAIETSSIWRATAPLRSAGQRSPRLAMGIRCGLKLAWWSVTLQLPRRYRLWRKHRQAQRPPVPEPAAPVQPLFLAGRELPAAARLLPEPPLAADQAGLQEKRLVAAELKIPFSCEPVVSVIITTFGQVESTLACLRPIAEYPPRSPIEVIIVDDACPDPRDAAVLADVQGVQLIRNQANLGSLISCQRAAEIAKGRYIHLLKNGTELHPGSIDALVELLERRPEAAMVGSKLLSPDGLLQEAGRIIWADGSSWEFGQGDDPSRPEYNYVREVDYCSAASLMVRRAAFEELGGCDQTFAPAQCGVADLAFCIRKAGMKVLFEPRSSVIQHAGGSHGTDVTAGVRSNQLADQTRMAERWAETLSREHYETGQHALRARDRARGRKVILVIDCTTLQPDRDAGSRSTMGIIESLLEAGWVVKFWPYDRAYRPVYTAAMERRGVEVLDDRFPGDLGTWLRESGGDLDHVLVCRPNIAVEVLPDLMRDADGVLSFYGLDLHFARMLSQAKIDSSPRLFAEAANMKRLERRVWRNFDVVMYPSEEEANLVRALAPRTMVRSIVPFCYSSFRKRTTPPDGHGLLFVGGFAHAPNVDAAIFLIREIVPLLEDVVGPVNVILAGSRPADAVRALGSATVTVTGDLSDEALRALYNQQRVSIIPLRFGAGVKGKVIESMAYGLPLVTTSIGAQGIPGIDAIVPVQDEPSGIVGALEQLLTNDVAWLSQSSAQLAFAERLFSKSAMRESVLAALKAGEEATKEAPHPLSPGAYANSVNGAADLRTADRASGIMPSRP